MPQSSGTLGTVLKELVSSANLVSDPHSVYRDAFRQRIQCWSLYSPDIGARRSRALPSGDLGLCCLVRQDHAFLDGRNFAAPPDSFGLHLELARVSHVFIAHRNPALARNRPF